MNAIECRDLTKSYQGFTLDHITFTLPPPAASWGWWGKTEQENPPL